MQQQQIVANPFALMMDPAAVFAALERSDRLNHLQSRICRPLDKPMLGQAQDELDSFSDAIDGIDASDDITD
ncbi:hypothetical protein BH11PSE8_BH11PSE8_21570 [soil metagenome]